MAIEGIDYTRDRKAYKAAYSRLYRKGHRQPKPKIDLSIRLLQKTDRVFGDAVAGRPELGICWPFLGGRTEGGYGCIRDNDGRLMGAHRAALEVALGRPLKPGMQANHHCDNPPCVRPRHLYEGTAHENVWDMIERERQERWRRPADGEASE